MSERAKRTSEEGRETRRVILQVAHDLFMTQGYRSVSTRQIAEACVLTQPALYRHFATKQDLYLAVLHEDLLAVHTGLVRLSTRTISIEKRLQQVARYLPVTRLDLRQMFHDITHELPPEVRQAIESAFHAQIIAPIAAIFAEGQEHGQLRGLANGGTDPTSAAFLLLNLLQAAAVPGNSSLSAMERAERIVTILLHGLLMMAPAPAEGHDPTNSS